MSIEQTAIDQADFDEMSMIAEQHTKKADDVTCSDVRELEEARARIVELEVHCERLTSVLIDVESESTSDYYDIPSWLYSDVTNAMNAKPEQSLAEVQVEAIEAHKAFIKSSLPTHRAPLAAWMKKELVTDDTVLEIRLSEFDDYANQLRAKAK